MKNIKSKNGNKFNKFILTTDATKNIKGGTGTDNANHIGITDVVNG